MKYLEVAQLSFLSRLLTNVDCGDVTVNGRVEVYSSNTAFIDPRTETQQFQQQISEIKLAAFSVESPFEKSNPKISPLFKDFFTAHQRLQLYSVHLNFGGKSTTSDKKLRSSLDRSINAELTARSPEEQLQLAASPFGPLTDPNSKKQLADLIATLNIAFSDYDFSNVKAEQFHKELSYHFVANTINTVLGASIPNYEQFRAQLWQTIDEQIQINDCSIYSFIADPDSDPFEEEGNVWSFNYLFYNRHKLKRILLITCRAQRQVEPGLGIPSTLPPGLSTPAYDEWVTSAMDTE